MTHSGPSRTRYGRPTPYRKMLEGSRGTFLPLCNNMMYDYAESDCSHRSTSASVIRPQVIPAPRTSLNWQVSNYTSGNECRRFVMTICPFHRCPCLVFLLLLSSPPVHDLRCALFCVEYFLYEEYCIIIMFTDPRLDGLVAFRTAVLITR